VSINQQKHIIMRTFIFLLLSSLLTVHSASAQEKTADPLKIVFQLTTDDTTAHKALMKQLGNITSVKPDTRIEVVCHGPGLDMLRKDRSIVADKVKGFAAKGITFSACEFSLKERNVPKESILPAAGFVEAGIIHIVTRQAEGWYYIKSGF
jgi:intracellular sulfur oxidation DsrE/DsrF family protein